MRYLTQVVADERRRELEAEARRAGRPVKRRRRAQLRLWPRRQEPAEGARENRPHTAGPGLCDGVARGPRGA
jgi:hypothetical protein